MLITNIWLDSAIMALFLTQCAGEISNVPACSEEAGIGKNVSILWTYTGSSTILLIEWKKSNTDGTGEESILIYNGVFTYRDGYTAAKIEHGNPGDVLLRLKDFQITDAHRYHVQLTDTNTQFDEYIDIGYIVPSDVLVTCDETLLSTSDPRPSSCQVLQVTIPNYWAHGYTVRVDQHDGSPLRKDETDCPSKLCTFDGVRSNTDVSIVFPLCEGFLAISRLVVLRSAGQILCTNVWLVLLFSLMLGSETEAIV